jgi:hypothetical protein
MNVSPFSFSTAYDEGAFQGRNPGGRLDLEKIKKKEINR